jgi:hypothetical protein
MGAVSLKPTAGTAAPGAGTRPAVLWRPKRELERHEWLVVGRRLGGVTRCNQWWLGDWVRYGAEKWGEKYTQAAKITGYDPRSLANMASIATAFDSSRRRDDLTWSHHVAVAGLPESEQEGWLDRAATEGLSVADLRTELRAAPKHGKRALAAEDAGIEAAAREGAEGDGVEPEILCPQCGYRLGQGDLE